MPPNCVSALLVTSSQTEAHLIEQMLVRCHHSMISLTVDESSELARTRLMQQQHFDVLLIATESEFSSRIDLMRWVNNLSDEDHEHCKPPVIALTLEDSATVYRQTLQAGATDSLPIDQLSPTLLEHSIRYAIRQRADETRLLRLAHFDPLTGLANRTLFKSRLSENIAQAKRADQVMALLIVDLDGFKTVNDTLGHGAGDELLTQAAERLHNSVRETDMVARLAGDEFAIIATQLHGSEDAATLASGILQACRFSIESELEDIFVSCSIGIALFPQDGHDSKQLLRQADGALLLSKADGGSCFHYAESALNQLTRERALMVADIGHALIRDQLQLHFQPIVCTDDQSIVSVEALLRWQHPSRGLLKPEHFLSAAEASGLINPIGAWVLHRACQQHLEWLSQGLPPISISINLSPAQLEQHTLIKTIDDMAQRDGFDVEYLTMELSECDVYQCSTEASDNLCELHDMGVHITVDNFGKEYCSLTQLQRLPIDALKIDRSLIHRISMDTDSAAVTEAIIQLAKVMGIDVIAQGVEDSAEIGFLSSKQCTQLQGYGIARPLSGGDFPLWYNEYSSERARLALH